MILACVWHTLVQNVWCFIYSLSLIYDTNKKEYAAFVKVCVHFYSLNIWKEEIFFFTKFKEKAIPVFNFDINWILVLVTISSFAEKRIK